MDRPRSVVSEFEPLTLTISTDPPGFAVTIDDRRIQTPRTYNWSNGTVHDLTADAIIDVNPSDPEKLAFESWSDLFDRHHSITVRRDTFVNNLTATYITIIPEFELPARSSRVVRTKGSRDWSKTPTLTVAADDGVARPALQIIRGLLEGELITETAIGTSEARVDTHTFVQGGTDLGETQIVLHNPGTEEAIVDLLLRDSSGGGLVARVDALRVSPGGTTTGLLENLIALDDPYEGLLSAFSDQPLMVSVQAIRSNLRLSTFHDPIMVLRPLEADRGVPEEVTVQALVLTTDTDHEFVLSNPGAIRLTGSIEFLDEDRQPLGLADGMASSRSYNLAPGGYEVIRFRMADGGGSGIPATGRVSVSPTFGQAAPIVQLVEEQTVGQSPDGPIVLPRTIPPSRTCTSFVVPVDHTRRDSGVILGNPSQFSAASVQVSLLDMDGAEVASAIVNLPPNRQNLVLSRETFPAFSGSFKGVIEGSSTSEVEAVGVFRQINGRGEQILAGFPVPGPNPGEPPISGDNLFPFAIDGDSWSSEFWHINALSTSPATVSFSFTGEEGETVHLPMEW
jgi:hypothetical protein